MNTPVEHIAPNTCKPKSLTRPPDIVGGNANAVTTSTITPVMLQRGLPGVPGAMYCGMPRPASQKTFNGASRGSRGQFRHHVWQAVVACTFNGASRGSRGQFPDPSETVLACPPSTGPPGGPGGNLHRGRPRAGGRGAFNGASRGSRGQYVVLDLQQTPYNKPSTGPPGGPGGN